MDSAIGTEETLSSSFQLGIMRNIEQRMPKRKRKTTPNWRLVQDYLLGHTDHGGKTSCAQHCLFLGIDPDGYTFCRFFHTLQK